MSNEPKPEDIVRALKSAIPPTGHYPSSAVFFEKLRRALHPPETHKAQFRVTAKRLKIEQSVFEQGTVLGSGDIESDQGNRTIATFQPAEGAEVVTAGHIQARLTNDEVAAEPISEAV